MGKEFGSGVWDLGFMAKGLGFEVLPLSYEIHRKPYLGSKHHVNHCLNS